MFPFLRRRPKQDEQPSENQLSSQRATNSAQAKASSCERVVEPSRERVVEAETIFAGDREVRIVRRAYKRSLSLTLQVNGKIRVTAPKGVSGVDIRKFVLSHERWIANHLSKYQAIRETYPPKKYVEGELFPLLGQDLKLHFVPTFGAMVRVEARQHEGALVVSIPSTQWARFRPNEEHPELKAAVRDFYKRFAKEYLSMRLKHYAQLMQLYPSSVSFRSQKTRWGSCSSRGRISLNWRLVIAPSRAIDYVVIHELSHLKHYNHSEAFWKLVATQEPGYREQRRWLQEHQYDGDFLATRSELHA